MAAAITHRAYARIGLLGNPSDGFFGKTIAVSIENFYAEVTLTPSDTIQFTPHPTHDPQQFSSLGALAARVQTHGFYGGIRLLQALCCEFHIAFTRVGAELPAKGFTLQYETSVPKQAGLSGSSAIICAGLKCLMQYFGVEGMLPKAELPNLILRVEAALGITAGLQDRVIQVYEGVVFMDFDQAKMEADGHGEYVPMDPEVIPSLFLIYAENPGDSGKVHNDVKQRWLQGDELVRSTMQQVAGIAAAGREALEGGDHARFAALMNENFACRRRMYGDAALGALNVRMVEVATECGAAAKFTGSGGCAVAFCHGGDAQVAAVRGACTREGFTMIPVTVHKPGGQQL